MALVLNEEQVMLKDSAAKYLAKKASVDSLRKLRDSGSEVAFCPEVWQEMVEMGWAGIAVPEEFGGLGYGYSGLGLVLEQVGRNLSSSPLESSILIAATTILELGSAEQKAEMLPSLAAGELLCSLALQEGGHHCPEQTAMSAVSHRDGYCLDGEKVLVLDASSANSFIVIARTEGKPGDEKGLSAFVVDSSLEGITVENRSMIDSRNAGAVIFNNVVVAKSCLLGEEGNVWGGLIRALDIANVGLSSQLLGISFEAFDRTISYLKERKQFGRIVGSFQALQHRAAAMFAELELGRSLVLKALQAIDAHDAEVPKLASAAKAKVSQIAEQISNEAIQMHGGIGMTDEHEIGFFIKRARVAQHCFGDYNYHLDRFARLNGY